jgi:hypothetical protein
MKTRTIIASLLIGVAASADARFASPYPRKAVSPDAVGHWILVNGNPWSHSADPRKSRTKYGGTGEILRLRTNDEQIYQNEDSLYGAAVKPGTRSSRQCETCCELAERAGHTIRR